MTPADRVSKLAALVEELRREVGHLGFTLHQTKCEQPARSNAKKLTKREVAKIRELSRLGAKNVDIAYGYDINPGTVSRIVRGIYHK